MRVTTNRLDRRQGAQVILALALAALWTAAAPAQAIAQPDLTPPTATINQGPSQVDPTSTTPIVFTVVFSEPVFGLTNADVTLSGTALPTTAVISGSGPAYTVAVSGMSQTGTVTATILANRVVDASGNPNQAS